MYFVKLQALGKKFSLVQVCYWKFAETSVFKGKGNLTQKNQEKLLMTISICSMSKISCKDFP